MNKHADGASEANAPMLDEIVANLPASHESANPLYVQLASTIRGLIETGVLRGSEALPSERDLAKATGFSRITVRNAIEDLFREGLLSRRRGAGTFVSPQIDQPLSILVGFTEDMKRRGAASKSIVLEKTSGIPSPDEALKLGLFSGDQVVRLSRVRLANGEPLAVENAVVPLSAVTPEAIGESLYDALRVTGHRPVRALQRLRAAIADAREAELLDVEVGTPVLHIERRAFLANGRPIEVTRSSYRGDRYDFVAELKIEP